MLRGISLLSLVVGVALAIFAATAEGAATPDARLLALYEPVMQFDPLEQFLPTKVESFITDADLSSLRAEAGLLRSQTRRRAIFPCPAREPGASTRMAALPLPRSADSRAMRQPALRAAAGRPSTAA
jgi:hypothetical protein